MRVQWTTSYARMERWAEEVELLQEEMRRVVMYLEWKAGHWLEKRDTRSAMATSSIQSGLQAYARKQAAIHHELAVSFSRLWYPTLVSYNLKHSWLTQYTKEHGILLTDTNTPTVQARGIFELRVSETDGGPPATTAPHILPENLPSPSVANTPILLEEADYVEEDDDNGLVDWDTSFSDLDGYEDDGFNDSPNASEYDSSSDTYSDFNFD